MKISSLFKTRILIQNIIHFNTTNLKWVVLYVSRSPTHFLQDQSRERRGSGAGEEAAGGFGDGRRDARFDQSRAAPDRAVLIQNSIFLQDQFYHLFVLHFCSKQNDRDVCRSVQV
jgi:hypothetical protein